MNSAQDLLFSKVVSFITSIGIPVHFAEISEACFLPGINISEGEIIVDKGRLKYPGDILHEAGHIAVVPAAERSLLDSAAISERPMREAEEMMAIAWSYAACIYLDIDPEFVFHAEGYKQDGSSIVENFKAGRYFGVPVLQWVGMTIEPKRGDEPGKLTYPYMLKWMRD